MREIKFRALDVYAKWVFGGPVINKDGVLEFFTGDYFIGGHYVQYESREVVEETIGQYTGLKDKNDQEVYEGDVCRILYTDWVSQSPNGDDTYPLSTEDYMNSIATIVTIEWSEENCGFCAVPVKENLYGEYPELSIIPGKHGFIEKIGTVHENPELLK